MCTTGDKLSCFDAGSPLYSIDIRLLEQTSGHQGVDVRWAHDGPSGHAESSRGTFSDHIETPRRETRVNLGRSATLAVHRAIMKKALTGLGNECI
jgi:hypothetical protein